MSALPFASVAQHYTGIGKQPSGEQAHTKPLELSSSGFVWCCLSQSSYKDKQRNTGGKHANRKQDPKEHSKMKARLLFFTHKTFHKEGATTALGVEPFSCAIAAGESLVNYEHYSSFNTIVGLNF
jgi:hypothetical protein